MNVYAVYLGIGSVHQISSLISCCFQISGCWWTSSTSCSLPCRTNIHYCFCCSQTFRHAYTAPLSKQSSHLCQHGFLHARSYEEILIPGCALLSPLPRHFGLSLNVPVNHLRVLGVFSFSGVG